MPKGVVFECIEFKHVYSYTFFLCVRLFDVCVRVVDLMFAFSLQYEMLMMMMGLGRMTRSWLHGSWVRRCCCCFCRARSVQDEEISQRYTVIALWWWWWWWLCLGNNPYRWGLSLLARCWNMQYLFPMFYLVDVFVFDFLLCWVFSRIIFIILFLLVQMCLSFCSIQLDMLSLL